MDAAERKARLASLPVRVAHGALGPPGAGLRLLARRPLGLLGVAIIAFYGLLTVLHPLLMRLVWDPAVYDPVTGYGFGVPAHPAPPSVAHPLGTDPLGRDVLSQLMFGARTEFALGVLAASVTLSVGVAVGAIAAYAGRWVDAVLMRLADLVVMMPLITFLVVLGALFDLGVVALALVVGAVSGLGATAIVVKSQALGVVVRPYVEAARAAGGSPVHVLATHVVPNLLPVALLSATFTVVAAVFAEAALSFFGIVNTRMSWGIMVHTAQVTGYLASGLRYWWLLMPAGLSISLLCAAFYLLGRALDDVVNPRLRRE